MGQPEALAGFHHQRATIVGATEVVLMDDAVEVALRRKKDSSMRVAIQQVKEGKDSNEKSNPEADAPKKESKSSAAVAK